MRYSIVAKDDYVSKELTKKIKETINGTYDEAKPSIVFSVGGDGTVLDAVRKYIYLLNEITLVAINTGNIGFYTEFLPEELNKLIKMLDDKTNIIKYPVLEVEIDGKVDYALNEVVVFVNHHLFEGKIFVDGTELMDIRADGVCISTPSGSTAYNKSLKGAVVDRDLELMQLVLMAPFETIDKRVITPLILNKDREVLIKPQSKYFDISVDRTFVTYQKVDEIKVRVSEKKVKFLRKSTQNFPKRLKEKFISST